MVGLHGALENGDRPAVERRRFAPLAAFRE
jgi:hypothetical protein